VILFQGAMQVAGVASVFPFLAIAADPVAFRASRLGSMALGYFPPLTDAQLLTLAGAFSIALLFVANASSLVGDYARARYAHGLGHWLQVRLLQEIASKPWAYFLQQNTGVLLKKTWGDVVMMVQGVLLPLLEGISRMVTAVLLTLTLFVVSSQIAIGAALILSIYYMLIFRVLQSRRSAVSEGLKSAYRGAMEEAQQLLGGIKPVKIHRSEGHFIDRFRIHSRSIGRLNAKLPLFFMAPKYILEPIAFGGVIAIVLIYSSLGKEFAQILPTLGVIGFVGYRLLPAAQLVYGQLSQISTSLHSLEEVYEEFKRLGSGAALQAGQHLFERGNPLPFSRSIRLDNVSFKYAEAARPVLRDLSLEIPRNTSLGVVGPTGSGKSTLVDLILGLHIPSAGRILIDDAVLTEANVRDWQATIGYVPQDIFLIDDTITRNIAFGMPDEAIDAARVREVAEMAQIRDFIESELPKGFETEVGERGVRLSGGQRQRIALARALYHRPSLLVFDEATSALDNQTETEVMRAINNLQGTVTLIIIAHRLSTIEGCDCILDLGSSSKRIRNSPSAEDLNVSTRHDSPQV
jgi:ATP-binding cassette subfamily C protein